MFRYVKNGFITDKIFFQYFKNIDEVLEKINPIASNIEAQEQYLTIYDTKFVRSCKMLENTDFDRFNYFTSFYAYFQHFFMYHSVKDRGLTKKIDKHTKEIQSFMFKMQKQAKYISSISGYRVNMPKYVLNHPKSMFKKGNKKKKRKSIFLALDIDSSININDLILGVVEVFKVLMFLKALNKKTEILFAFNHSTQYYKFIHLCCVNGSSLFNYDFNRFFEFCAISDTVRRLGFFLSEYGKFKHKILLAGGYGHVMPLNLIVKRHEKEINNYTGFPISEIEILDLEDFINKSTTAEEYLKENKYMEAKKD